MQQLPLLIDTLDGHLGSGTMQTHSGMSEVNLFVPNLHLFRVVSTSNGDTGGFRSLYCQS